MNSRTDGIVYLVGAGPGDAGLVTLRAVDLLRRADVVIYDNLANPEILRHAPISAERIYAGKKADQHTKTQEEINALLADRARAGLTVVRLKGGDPFLFGRGGEEAGWLSEHGIAWEVVPGVTSAIAVPAYAGIPVTHRSVNGSVHIVTGHENVEGLGADIDWSVFARSRGTIVLMMGVKNLGTVTEELMRNGMAATTPVAMVRWGTRSNQETLVSRLDKVVEDVEKAGLKPPAVTIIGEVVNLRQTLAWVEKRPLFGIRVGVTRPFDENDGLAKLLEDRGAEVVRTPTLKVVPLPVTAEATGLMKRLAARGFNWLVFTSANGVREFNRMWLESGHDARHLAGTKVAVIGVRTAECLKARGVVADLVVTDSRQEGVAEALLAENPARILIARALDARHVLEERLAAAGVKTEVLPVYETVPDEMGIKHLLDELRAGKLQAITFTSARTFEALAEASTEPAALLLAKCSVAVIGPVTRAALEGQGIEIAAEAKSADMSALADALVEWRGKSH